MRGPPTPRLYIPPPLLGYHVKKIIIIKKKLTEIFYFGFSDNQMEVHLAKETKKKCPCEGKVIIIRVAH